MPVALAVLPELAIGLVLILLLWAARALFGGMLGPFCLECIVTDDMKIKVFEISSRIVAGTNPFISGSPYSDLIEPGLTTGRRIAQEIRFAGDHNRLKEVLT